MGRVHCEWGMGGVASLRARVAAMVIVDVLSFSTAVDVAVGLGGEILPFAHGDDEAADRHARRMAAQVAAPRGAAGWSLSPASLRSIPAGTRLVLPSPNGSALSRAAGEAPLFAGCLRNAPAVAKAVRGLAGDRPVAVIPAGERWPDGSLRPAIEDLLGAGAVIHHLGLAASAEAEVARDAFRSAGGRVAALVAASTSGQELIARGFDLDVELAVDVGVSACAPFLRDGAYRPFSAPP